MNWDETYKYVRDSRQIDGSNFNKVTDFTSMIDFQNNEAEKKSKERMEEDIHEISKMVVRMMTQKTIILRP